MMRQILAQLLAQKNYAPLDLILRLDEVWNRAMDDVAFLFSKQEYPGPDNDYCKLLYLPVSGRCFQLSVSVILFKGVLV